MAADGGGLIGFIAVVAGIAAIHGWFSGKAKKREDDEYNRNLKQQLHDERARLRSEVAETERELKARSDYITTLRREFENGYMQGRKWLSQFVGEADRALDESIALALRRKKRPALKAAEEVAAARAEKRRFKEQLKFLEYQLKSYKEYFPFLEEYEDIILDEAIPLAKNDTNLSELKNTDPVRLYVPKAEYEGLSTTERNQLALDRYLKRSHSQAEIGRFYERYLGYLYEKEGWDVRCTPVSRQKMAVYKVEKYPISRENGLWYRTRSIR